MVVRITSDAASNTSGIQSWRRGPRAPKKRRAAPTGVKAMGWGRKRTATAKRINTYASMDHLERHSILGAVEAGVKRGCGQGAYVFREVGRGLRNCSILRPITGVGDAGRVPGPQ